jgi:hypothetical protein
MPSDWTEYIDAAHRKISIAQFHCEQLGIRLQQESELSFDQPSIPVQAFFEGVVVATIAAIDQVTRAAHSAFKISCSQQDFFSRAASEIEKRVPEFKVWYEKPIGVDLRRLRVRMVHYEYKKTFDGKRLWMVEEANDNYKGTRDLLAYAKDAVDYASELGLIANKLKDSLLINVEGLANTEVK